MTIVLNRPVQEDRDELNRRASTLAAAFRARAAEGEALRTMPADLAATVKRAGLFRLALPATLGGWETDPLTIFEVIERLANADGSAGWTVLIGNSTMLMAWLDPDVARELIAGDPDFCSTGVFAPTGTATPAGPGSFTVDGRWACSSGCAHSEWFVTGVLVTDGERVKITPEGRPDWRFAWFPSVDGDIFDTWHAAGLKGTGSHDVIANAVSVPEERTAAPMFEPARHDGPLYRLTFYNLLTALMPAFSSGVGRRALDEFIDYADRKHRGPSPTSVADDHVVQHQLAIADSNLRAARAFFFEAMGEAWSTVVAGDPCTLEQRARVMAAAQTLHRAAVAAVDTVLPLSGASAVYADHPIQRCARDLHAASQHIFFNVGTLTHIGQVALGRTPESPRF